MDMENYNLSSTPPKMPTTILPAMVTSLSYYSDRFYVQQSNYNFIEAILFSCYYSPELVGTNDECVAVFVITPKKQTA